jgi:hypothetical protein
MPDDDDAAAGQHRPSSASLGSVFMRPPARGLAAAALVAAYAWWAVGLAPFSWPATLAVVGAGAAAAAWGAWHRRAAAPGAPGASVARVAPWAALAAVAAVWQLAAYLQHPRDDHPTLSSLTNAALDSHAARAAAFVVWLAATVALARR